jgi:hypothetical protein
MIHRALLWFARIAGLVMTLLFFSFFLGEGLPDLLKGEATSLMAFLPFCIPSFAGYVLGWFRPLQGGILMMIGALVMAGWFIYYGDIRMAFVFGLPSLLVGLSYLGSVNRELV